MSEDRHDISASHKQSLPERKLAAIMFTDIVGYTALMGKDEDKAFEILDQNLNLHKSLIEKYKGKFLKPYWVNTSDNELIREVLQMDKVKSKETLEKLIKGEEVREVIVQNIVYKNIKTEFRAGWNFLLQSGYLKASDPVLENVELS